MGLCAIVETNRKVVQPLPSSCVPVGHLEVFFSQWQEVLRFIVTLQGSSKDRWHFGDNSSVYVSMLVMDYQDKRANRASPRFSGLNFDDTSMDSGDDSSRKGDRSSSSSTCPPS